MYTDLGTVRLKSGQSVQAGIVQAPDADWHDRLTSLLSHKGDPWNWQNTSVLRRACDIDVRFHILHRDGQPLSNIMVAELAGVGLFGHVWTNPADRRQGAASLIQRFLMDHFRERGGKALFLCTGFDSPPYHIYRAAGFQGLEDRSGQMAYFTDGRAAFETDYFSPGPTEIQPIGWRHWPAAAALFTGDYAGTVRCAPLRLIGRLTTEEALLRPIRDAEAGSTARAVALVQTRTTAVVGLAAWDWDAVWPETVLLDVYCHPAHWDRAAELLDRLPALTRDCRAIALCDVDMRVKQEVLRGAGFKPVTLWPRWAFRDKAARQPVDVSVFQRG